MTVAIIPDIKKYIIMFLSNSKYILSSNGKLTKKIEFVIKNLYHIFTCKYLYAEDSKQKKNQEIIIIKSCNPDENFSERNFCW